MTQTIKECLWMEDQKYCDCDDYAKSVGHNTLARDIKEFMSNMDKK